jgi:mannosylglycerate hydrolase
LEPDAPAPRSLLPALTAIDVIATRSGRERLEFARHYPDNDLVSVTRAAVWVDNVPGVGARVYPIGARRGRNGPVPNPVFTGASALENGLVAVERSPEGVVRLVHRLPEFGTETEGAPIVSAILLESATDAGDLYTPSIRGPRKRIDRTSWKTVQRGRLLGEARVRWPVATREAPSREIAETITSVIATVSVRADSPAARFHLAGVSSATDHRLRIGFATGLAGAEIWADAAFGPVHRAPPASRDDAMEARLLTAPLHRYVSLFAGDRGVTLISDGLAEYEVDAEGTVWVTLVRSVGELSRNDIPERPGHAGWPAATPEAQCLGPFEATFAVLPHAERSSDVIDFIERAADDVLVPLVGVTHRNAVAPPDVVGGITLEGEGLAVSAIKVNESGDAVVLRCVNLLDEPVEGSWSLPRSLAEAWNARLDETPLDPIEVRGKRVEFIAPPRAIVTVLVR